MDVVIYPGSSLRRGGKTIEVFDDELRQVVADMFETMYSHKGVGLAAPQVGLPLNLFVLNPSGDAEEKEGERVLINPEIVKRKGHEFGEEGCLSFPDLYAEVERSKDIRIRYQDLEGQEHEERFEGFLARVIQHETDHLKGVVFTDRLSSIEKLRVRGSLQEFERRATQKS